MEVGKRLEIGMPHNGHTSNRYMSIENDIGCRTTAQRHKLPNMHTHSQTPTLHSYFLGHFDGVVLHARSRPMLTLFLSVRPLNYLHSCIHPARTTHSFNWWPTSVNGIQNIYVANRSMRLTHILCRRYFIRTGSWCLVFVHFSRDFLFNFRVHQCKLSFAPWIC